MPSVLFALVIFRDGVLLFTQTNLDQDLPILFPAIAG
jgi:hypothetical protein